MFTQQGKSFINILDPYFVTGLTEAEGSFSITKHKDAISFGLGESKNLYVYWFKIPDHYVG